MIEKLIAEARGQATWDIPESTEILLLKMADLLERLKPKTPTTNFERIKAMTVEEFIEWCRRKFDCFCCPAWDKCDAQDKLEKDCCQEALRNYLESEVQNNDR